MAVHGTIARGRVIALCLCFLAIGGCSRIRLPAIDPTGQRIFLPPPASTSLAFPDIGPFPRSAFPDVPVPPPCGTSVPAPPVAPPQYASSRGLCGSLHGEDNIPGRLQLSPTRLIAPINSEVVLLSGLCGDEGFLITKQPIEFTLSQDSVGQFVDASEDDGCLSRYVGSKTFGKLASNYVVTRTSQHEYLVTRGTPAPNDDVLVNRGHSWASLSSATEGSSYVTVVAANAANWDKRRQTATIHWVDAQWTFPTPSVAPAGDRVSILTTVTKSDGSPLNSAWLVRYEVLGGTPATFGRRGENSIEIPTDPQGRAGADLVSPNADPGTTQVKVQIIRPASNGTPKLVVGEGYTSVTWRAAGLAIQLSGPSAVLVGSPLVYRAIVTNPGDIASSDVVITSNLPPRITFLESNRPAERIGDGIQWKLGSVAPKASVVIEIQCRAEQPGSMTLFVEGQSREGRRAKASIATDIVAASLKVRLSVDQETVDVGAQVVFLAEIENTGDRPLVGINLVSRFDEGLEHKSRQRSPLSNLIENLAPGETQEVTLTFFVRRPGQLCNVLEVSAPNSQRATARACTTGVAVAARTKLDLDITGPTQRTVGEVAEITLSVTNTGNAALANVRVAAAYDATRLIPQVASPGYRQEQGEILWVVPLLRPGESEARQVNFLCPQAADVQIRGTASAGTTTSEPKVHSVRILDNPTAGPRRNPDELDAGTPATPPAATPGNLVVSLNDVSESIGIGQRNKYELNITNDRNTTDRNLVVTFTVPPGLTYTGIFGLRPVSTRDTADGRVVVGERINEVRPREQLKYVIEVEGKTPGTHTMRVQVVSQLEREPVEAEDTTTVNAQ